MKISSLLDGYTRNYHRKLNIRLLSTVKLRKIEK